jgi:hypothetical protein
MLGVDGLLSSLLSKILNLCSSSRVIGQGTHPYKAKHEALVQCIDADFSAEITIVLHIVFIYMS